MGMLRQVAPQIGSHPSEGWRLHLFPLLDQPLVGKINFLCEKKLFPLKVAGSASSTVFVGLATMRAASSLIAVLTTFPT